MVNACYICGKVSQQKCSRCHAVPYCSIACQKRDWLTGHKEVCLTITKGLQTGNKKTEFTKTTPVDDKTLGAEATIMLEANYGNFDTLPPELILECIKWVPMSHVVKSVSALSKSWNRFALSSASLIHLYLFWYSYRIPDEENILSGGHGLSGEAKFTVANYVFMKRFERLLTCQMAGEIISNKLKGDYEHFTECKQKPLGDLLTWNAQEWIYVDGLHSIRLHKRNKQHKTLISEITLLLLQNPGLRILLLLPNGEKALQFQSDICAEEMNIYSLKKTRLCVFPDESHLAVNKLFFINGSVCTALSCAFLAHAVNKQLTPAGIRELRSHLGTDHDLFMSYDIPLYLEKELDWLKLGHETKKLFYLSSDNSMESELSLSVMGIVYRDGFYCDSMESYEALESSDIKRCDSPSIYGDTDSLLSPL